MWKLTGVTCVCLKEKKKGSVRFLYLNMENYSNRKKSLTGVIHSFKIICEHHYVLELLGKEDRFVTGQTGAEKAAVHAPNFPAALYSSAAVHTLV